MIARLANLRKHPSVFRHLTGITPAVFDDLAAVVVRVFRVFDRANNYRLIARVPTSRFILADVADGPTAVVTTDRNAVAVWDLSGTSTTAILPSRGGISALAISADGRRVCDAARVSKNFWRPA